MFKNTREDIIKKCEDLNRVIAEKRVRIKVVPGSEVRMCPEVVEELENSSIMTVNDNKKYLYIELPGQFPVDAVLSFMKMMKESISNLLLNNQKY